MTTSSVTSQLTIFGSNFAYFGLVYAITYKFTSDIHDVTSQLTSSGKIGPL